MFCKFGNYVIMIKVSIVIPIYNTERYLPDCLDSITLQSYKNIEIICVDDGSTDNTPVILEQYAKKDSRIKIITQPNAGPGAARNTGMYYASGEYILFLDSDDWFESGLVYSMVHRATDSSADITICKSTQFDSSTGKELLSLWMLNTKCVPNLVFTPERISDKIFQFTYGWPWDKLYRSDFIKQFSFPALKNSEDLVFVYESLVSARRIAIQDEILVHHRVNRSQSTSSKRELDPKAPYKATCLLKQYLQKNNMWTTYERSFITWAVNFLFWHASDLRESTVKRTIHHMTRKKWLPELGCMEHKAFFYEPGSIRCKYLLIKYAPYWFFDAVTRLHRIIK